MKIQVSVVFIATLQCTILLCIAVFEVLQRNMQRKHKVPKSAVAACSPASATSQQFSAGVLYRSIECGSYSCSLPCTRYTIVNYVNHW